MKERRFKIGYVSMNVAASWGKELGDQINEAVPDEAIVLKQHEDFYRASIAILIYHPNFPIIADGEKVPKTILDIKAKEKEDKKVILHYNH